MNAEQSIDPDQDGSANQAAQPQSLEEAMAAMPRESERALRLAKLGGVHALVWLAVVGLFAAVDSWAMLTGLPVAGFFGILAGALAGVVTTSLIHEWFHFLGARVSGGAYGIPDKPGAFVYEWDFNANSLRQFFTMSVAGTLGGALSLLLIWFTLPMDTLARAALLGGAVGAFAFAAYIEWPVLRRTRESGNPLGELSKIDRGVLEGSLVTAGVTGALTLLLLAP